MLTSKEEKKLNVCTRTIVQTGTSYTQTVYPYLHDLAPRHQEFRALAGPQGHLVLAPRGATAAGQQCRHSGHHRRLEGVAPGGQLVVDPLNAARYPAAPHLLGHVTSRHVEATKQPEGFLALA